MGEIFKTGIDVLRASRERIQWAFNTFPKLYLSFSGGKDSSVMLHLVIEEAKQRNQKIAVLFIDLEAQYKLTIEHIQELFVQYAEWIEPYWVCLPFNLRNAVSQYEPQWCCWEPGKDWVRRPPQMAITDQSYFPFYKYRMEFEEFVEAFGHWYAKDALTGCFVGIRTDESLNRYRAITGLKTHYPRIKWSTHKGQNLFNLYPIYDWRTRDIWVYNGKYKKTYNKLYDRMHQAGLSISQMRICQPYGDDQRRGLWLFHLIEPETWGKVVSRVNGANAGALYCNDSGNILGNIKITKPEEITWQQFAQRLLASMPAKTKDHFEDKITMFLKWYQNRGYEDGIPDFASLEEEASKKVPSWRRICKMLLKNDYWAKGLSFSQHKSEAYEKYKKLMKKRRAKWQIKI